MLDNVTKQFKPKNDKQNMKLLLFTLEDLFESIPNKTTDEKKQLQDFIDEVEFKATSDLETRSEVFLSQEAVKRKQRRLEIRTPSNISETKSDRDLYRRFEGLKETDKKPMTDEDVKKIDGYIKNEEDDPCLPECFVNGMTSLNATKTATNSFLNNQQRMANINPCLFFGLNGIPIVHHADNYIDPMNLGYNDAIKDVASAKANCLNQSTLWHASQLNQGHTLIRQTGVDQEFTAVIPIKAWNHPKVWEAFMKTTTFGRFLMSAQLRKSFQPLPADHVAFTSATFLKTISMWKQPSDAQAIVMQDLLDTIQHVPKTNKHLIDSPNLHIMESPYMYSSLGPMARVLESKEVFKHAGTNESRDLWRAMLSNSIFWKVKKAMKRGLVKKEEVLRLLKKGGSLPNKEVLQKYAEDIPVFARIFQVAKQFNRTNTIGEECLKESSDTNTSFEHFVTSDGFNFDVYLATEVVKALLCRRTVDRLNSSKFSNFDTEEDCLTYLEEACYRFKQDYVHEEKKQYLKRENSLENILLSLPDLSLSLFARHLNEHVPSEFDKTRTDGNKTTFTIEKIINLLQRDGTNKAIEKLILILMGKVHTFSWNGNKFLRNDKISKMIIDTLIPMLKDATSDVREICPTVEWLRN